MLDSMAEEFALRVGIPCAAGAGIFSTFFASTMLYVVTVNPLFGAASSTVVLGSAAANSTAGGAGFFSLSSVVGVSSAAALGIGAAVTLAVGAVVVGVSANWEREDVHAEFEEAVIDNIRSNEVIRNNCETAAQAAYASFARDSLTKAIEIVRDTSDLKPQRQLISEKIRESRLKYG